MDANSIIGTKENKVELSREKEAEAKRLEVKKEEKVKEVRDEYMTRIKKAKTAAEKERLLTEMQNRIKSVADELERVRRSSRPWRRP